MRKQFNTELAIVNESCIFPVEGNSNMAPTVFKDRKDNREAL